LKSLGVEHLTALELAPANLVREAAKVGFKSVGLRVHPVTADGLAYPTSPGTREHQELRDLLRSEGVCLHDIEFIQLTPDVNIKSFGKLLESGADLGAICVTVSGDDPDSGRLVASFAALCDLAAPFGLRVDLEFMRWRKIGNLQQAVGIVAAADRTNGCVLLDALHLDRSGGTPADVRQLPAGWIRAVQLADAPATRPRTDEEAIAEARRGRLAPGEGVLPLSELLSAVSPDVALSVEMPMPGLKPSERLALAYAAMVRTLASVSGR
jgi:sugar phosphate isomerase/epimerase